MVKRLGAFLRSVLPENPTQLVLVFAVVCLLIAPHLGWRPTAAIHVSTKVLPNLRIFVGFAFCAILFAGSAGYFACFRPGRHPARRLLWSVCFPALVGLILMSSFYVYAAMGPFSASEISSVSPRSLGTSLSIVFKLGPGFHYALVGFILAAGFTWRVALGSASLPLALPQSSVSASDEPTSWHRVEIFLWVLVALLPAIHWVFPFTNFIYYFFYSHLPAFKDIAASSAQLFFTDASIILVAVWMIGREAWDALRRSLRWPTTDGLALAAAFPVGIAALVSVGQFFFDLLRWASYQSDKLRPPQIGSYFTLPSIGLFLLLFVALAEEIIFRGVLQPRFIRRYGPLRGIFLVGIVFAAAHLSADFSIGFTDALVILGVCLRVGQSLGLSFVAGWLTLRTGSVLPAAVAHGLLNVLGSSPFGPGFRGIGPLTDLLWAVLAWLLFRYWPVQTKAVQESGAPIPNPASRV